MSGKLLAFPSRPSPETGVLLGRSPGIQPCPDCDTPLQVYRASWTKGEEYPHHNHSICFTCKAVYGPIDRETAGPSGAPLNGGEVVSLASRASTVTATLRYDAWIADDGLVRVVVTNRGPLSISSLTIANSIGLTAAQAEKISGDFKALADAAHKQEERLRGDDRWRVRPCPDRSGVYLVKRHIWAGQYREAPFVATEIKKPRICEACDGAVKAGGTMYREEKGAKWAHPSWRDVRICSACVARVDRGSPESTAAEPLTTEGTTS